MATIMPAISSSNFVATKIHNGFYKGVTEMVEDYRKRSMEFMPTAKTTYEIVPLTKNDTDKVIHFLRRFFFRDEPLNVAIGLLDEPNTTCPELEEFCISCIPDGLSLAAVSSTGYLMGVCLNGLITREHAETENSNDEINNCKDPKFKKILRFLSTLKKHSDVFGHFPNVDKVLDIVILSVDESCRGQGICKALVQKTRETAIEHNIPLIRVDCSSQFSAKAVSRLGFKSIYTISYADYVDSDGKPIFNTQAPHTCATTFVLPLLV